MNTSESQRNKSFEKQRLQFLEEPGMEFLVGIGLYFLSIPGVLLALVGDHFLPMSYKERSFVALNNLFAGLLLWLLMTAGLFSVPSTGFGFVGILTPLLWLLPVAISLASWCIPALMLVNLLRARDQKKPILIPMLGLDQLIVDNFRKLMSTLLK